MKYVAIYVRKSRLKEEDGIELNKQVELLTEYADKRGYTYDIYKEQGSSEDWDRFEFQRMIKMIKKDAYSGVLVTDLDRVTRDRTDFGLFTRLLTQHDMKLVTLSKEYDFEEDDDIFISGIQSEMDNQFMRITKRKLSRGKYQAVNKGVWIGVTPLGYSKDKNTKTLIPAQDGTEELVRVIYDKFLQDVSISDICREIEARGLTPYGKNYINDSTVRKILRNIVYIGTVKYKKPDGSYIFVEDAHEAIISKETYNKAQELWKGRPKRPVHSIAKHPLSGLIKCAKCGQNLTVTTNHFKGKKYMSISTCKTAQHRTKKENYAVDCDNKSVAYDRLQEAVTRAIRDDIKAVDEDIFKLVSGEYDTSEEERRAQQMRDTVNRLEAQKKKVQQGFVSGIFDEKESQEQIRDLNQQMEGIKYELASTDIRSSEDREQELREYKKFMEDSLLIDWFADTNATNRLLKSFINAVYFSKDKADNRYTKNPFEILVKYS